MKIEQFTLLRWPLSVVGESVKYVTILLPKQAVTLHLSTFEYAGEHTVHDELNVHIALPDAGEAVPRRFCIARCSAKMDDVLLKWRFIGHASEHCVWEEL